MKQCFSVGDIEGEKSGGITDASTGRSGSATISQCYSLGEIRTGESGGISGKGVGDRFAGSNEHIVITDCYSRGNVTGDASAGISGNDARFLTLVNGYASGYILHEELLPFFDWAYQGDVVGWWQEHEIISAAGVSWGKDKTFPRSSLDPR